jgi:hypothetical protein
VTENGTMRLRIGSVNISEFGSNFIKAKKKFTLSVPYQFTWYYGLARSYQIFENHQGTNIKYHGNF